LTAPGRYDTLTGVKRVSDTPGLYVEFKQNINHPALFFFPAAPPPGLVMPSIGFNRLLRGAAAPCKEQFDEKILIALLAAWTVTALFLF
jgi:hypothetical protein